MVAWDKIDTVLLDMDGTLLDLHFDSYFWLHHLPQRYAEIHNTDPKQTRAELVGRITKEHGSLQWYCTDYWSQQLDLDIIALKREVDHKVALRPFVMEFLGQLKNSHRGSLLVTNASRDSVDMKMNKINLLPLFDEVVSSHDYGHAKEQQDFWQQLHANHPFDPSRTLLIDDTESVLTSADNFGIEHLLTLTQPDSQKALRENLLFPSITHFDEIMPSPILIKRSKPNE
jgi:HAD superfamily hydrolase (TIGR01509 family)